jgi:hypothetical protein
MAVCYIAAVREGMASVPPPPKRPASLDFLWVCDIGRGGRAFIGETEVVSIGDASPF